MSKREPRSPWRRQNKVKHQYTPAYYAAEVALRSGDREAARKAGAIHTRSCVRDHGPMPGAPRDYSDSVEAGGFDV